MASPRARKSTGAWFIGNSLNFGDCLAYATAATASDTLLFVGDDFRNTDVPPA